MTRRTTAPFIAAILLFSCTNKTIHPVANGTLEQAIENSKDDDVRVYAGTEEAAHIIAGVRGVSRPVENRRIASEEKYQTADQQASKIAIYLPSQEMKQIDADSAQYRIKSKKETDELENLSRFLISKASHLGIQTSESFDLQVKSVLNRDNQTIIRFQQILIRQHGEGFAYQLPVEGAGLVVLLEEGRIRTINSSLADLPKIYVNFNSPGLDLSDLTSHQMGLLLTYLKSNAQGKKVTEYFASLARSSGLPFNLESFLKDDLAQQRQRFISFFRQLGAKSTLKMMLDMAKNGRLSLAKRPRGWVFQATHVFELPIEFDIDFPKKK